MRINYRASSPPGQWRWLSPSGHWLSSLAATSLVKMVTGYLRQNGLPPKTEVEIEHEICHQMGLMPPYCSTGEKTPAVGLSFNAMRNFFRTVKDFILTKQRLAPMEEVERRKALCVRCPRNRPFGRCESCDTETKELVGTDNIIDVARQPKTPGVLHNCMQCGCRLSLKIQLSDEVLMHDTAKYPSDWCWMPAIQSKASAEAPPSADR